jgi:cytochrome c oxidase assembly protein subunit 15
MLHISTWLKSLILAVMLMVVVGGATRLTHSGLSMAQWKPLHVLPPTSQQAWDEEFSMYKQTPEYKHINKGMSLHEFKGIYWWEYGHRLLGRLVGFLVLLPLFFLFKNTPNWLRNRIAIVFTLGGIQGVIGWWMVKSGLKANPEVSHIRLCIHLVMAFILLSILARTLWRYEGKLFKKTNLKDTALLGLIGLTIVYGAYVAGLKAGLIYNTFPLMEGQWLPSEWNFYQPVWKNFINNPATVQWMHRVLALTTLAYSSSLWIKHGSNYRLLTIKLAVQVLIGVSTLLFQVPLAIALLHQAWAMIVWLVALKTVWVSGGTNLKFL